MCIPIEQTTVWRLRDELSPIVEEIDASRIFLHILIGRSRIDKMQIGMRQICKLKIARLISARVVVASVSAEDVLRIRDGHRKCAAAFRADEKLSMWNASLRGRCGEVRFQVFLTQYFGKHHAQI